MTAIGPTMIHIVADTVPGERVYGVRVHRTPLTGPYEYQTLWKGFGYKDSHGEFVQDALPDTTYRYRGVTLSGTSSPGDSDESDEVTVRTPSEPTTPPEAPGRLVARAISPFSVELAWEDRGDNEYGFEVEQRMDDGTFFRVALVDADQPRFVHHGLRPETEVAYRVRAFNPRGVSAETEEVRTRTPRVEELSTPPDDAPATPAACISREEALDMADEAGSPETSTLEEIPLGHGRTGDLISSPSSCGTGGCNADLYAVYDGCYRRLGTFFTTGISAVGESPSGWPLLASTAHCNAESFTVSTYQLVGGTYVEVDGYTACTFEQPLTESSPPFRSACDEYEPCQQVPGNQ